MANFVNFGPQTATKGMVEGFGIPGGYVGTGKPISATVRNIFVKLRMNVAYIL